MFVKISYSPIRLIEKVYVYTKLGYGIETEISNGGFLFNPGLSYKLNLHKFFNFNFMLGYHLQSIRYDILYHEKEGAIIDKKTGHNYRHSLSFGMGLIF